MDNETKWTTPMPLVSVERDGSQVTFVFDDLYGCREFGFVCRKDANGFHVQYDCEPTEEASIAAEG